MRKIAVTFHQGYPWVAISEENPDRYWSVDQYVDPICSDNLQLSQISSGTFEKLFSLAHSDNPVAKEILDLLYNFFLLGVEVGMNEGSNNEMLDVFARNGRGILRLTPQTRAKLHLDNT